MGFIGLVADAATTIQQETSEITRFFSIAHVKQLLNDLGNWSVSLIGKIVIVVLIWFIGKKIIRVLDKLVKKMLDRSTLDKGVVNFVVSVLKFVMYAILIMIVVDKLGFLPGDLQSKVDPYLRPLYDALFQIMGAESFNANMEKGLIEVAPLAYMRGRTLDNAFIILDEAQNTTPAQMKMFLTRIGFGSKVVVTGDMTQKDLPRDTVSGLEVATKVLSKVEEIAFIKLTNKDVVRHPLVQKIVKAYEDYEENQAKAAKRREARKGSQTGRRKD